MATGDFPGAMAPERQHQIDVGGLRLAVHEWGSEAAPPLFLVHGGFDFSRTYEVFAPKLAAAGWRVIAWDQRGHGDSDHAPLYGWDADIRDAMAVMDAITQAPAPVIGHSKGGSLMIQLADAQPHRFSHLVNLDGLPSKRRIPDVAEHERTRMVAGEIAGWLDHRRARNPVPLLDERKVIERTLPIDSDAVSAVHLLSRDQTTHGLDQQPLDRAFQVPRAILDVGAFPKQQPFGRSG